MTDEILYGLRPGDTEDRMVNSRRFYSNKNKGLLALELDVPLTIQAKLIFKELEFSFSNSDAPFYRDKEVRRIIGNLAWDLGMSDIGKRDKFSYLIEDAGHFQSEIAALIKLMAVAGERSRYPGRKVTIEGIISTLRSRMDTFMAIHGEMTAVHLLLQKHFIAERCGAINLQKFDYDKLTIFYEPLYLYRDEYFDAPSGENLLNYLRCWEHLVAEPYYQLLPRASKAKKKNLKIRELADQLEAYAFMELIS